MSWRPALGAVPEPGGTWFRVWAPRARHLEVEVERPDASPLRATLEPEDGGRFACLVPDARPGARYRLRLDGSEPMPDPASRFQPEGVHGPSEIVDPTAFSWSDHGWRGIALEDLVLYELHVGTFTPEGTFAAAARRLPELRELGITAVLLMPVADFPGDRNWGYDGAALFAPAHCYGRPDDLRRLVDAAHRAGIAVHLDVVYNHFGPDGAYAAAFSPLFFTSRHRSPWGDGINLDDEGSAGARAFFIENALHWVHEYHLDGLRLDATHAMVDESPRHFLAELSSAVRDSVEGREVQVIAEDARNLAHMVKHEDGGGWGLDAVWSDDFHHQVRVALAGDRDGYFVDFTGSMEDLACTIRQGWFYTGQHSTYGGHPRGSDPSGVPLKRFVFFIQNHDQVGNRAYGDRLHHAVEPAAWRAASAVLLCAPETPLLFMGQEWAASAPFRFFTDHHAELGALVTAGRRREFARFASFADAAAREHIPDPQAEATFLVSRPDWSERGREPHAAVLRLYQVLLELRRTEPALRGARADARALDADTLCIERRGTDGTRAMLIARLRGAGTVSVPADVPGEAHARAWDVRLTTEDPRFAPDPRPIAVAAGDGRLTAAFARPGAVLLASEAS